MKMKKRDFVGLALLAFVVACRVWTPAADFYAERCYPLISAALSWPASLVRFSLEEIVVVGFILALLAVIVRAVRRKKGFLWWLGRTARVALWVTVWFYLGWGNNYFRTPLYARMEITPAHFEAEAFDRFLSDYTDALNACADSRKEWEPFAVEQSVRDFYADRAVAYGYAPLRRWQHVKKPFFCEAQLNLALPDLEYPFVLAHEMAHLSGVTGEGEANYWAYAFCRRSQVPAVRYSGLLFLFPYVVSNARALLPREQYEAWRARIPQRVPEDTAEIQAYWDARRVGIVEKVQHWMMDLFLRSNGIAGGAQDYSGVVGMIMTMDAYEEGR